jgi:hypothetical protein
MTTMSQQLIDMVGSQRLTVPPNSDDLLFLQRKTGEPLSIEYTTMLSSVAWTKSNVKEFGAKGDGVTDDTVAINAALDSVGAGPGVVFFPPGVYIHSSNTPLIVHSNTWVIGYGAELRLSNGGNVYGLSLYEGSNSHVRGLKILMVDTGGAKTWYGISIANFSNYSVKDCHIEDPTWSTTKDHTVSPTLWYGIGIFQGTTTLKGSTYPSDGSEDLPCHQGLIANNIIKGCAQYALEGFPKKPSDLINISGNIIENVGNSLNRDNSPAGIKISFYENCNVYGNTLKRCFFGIIVAPNFVTSVFGNTITDFDEGGISIAINGHPYFDVSHYQTLAVSSVTRSGNVATVTTSVAHNLITGDKRCLVGAEQWQYNGRNVVTVTGPTTFTYPVYDSPTTPATGTMQVKNQHSRELVHVHGNTLEISKTYTPSVGGTSAIWAIAKSEFTEGGVILIENNVTHSHDRNTQLRMFDVQPKRPLRNLIVRNNEFHGNGFLIFRGYSDTFNAATGVDTATDRINSGSHGFIDGARLLYRHTPDDIGGLTDNTYYYVKVIDTNNFELYDDPGLTLLRDLTTTGTGTATVYVPLINFQFIGNLVDNRIVDVASKFVRITGDNSKIIGNTLQKSTTYGLYVMGANNKIIGNYFEELDSTGTIATICIVTDTKFTTNLYVLKNVVLDGNPTDFIWGTTTGFPDIHTAGNILPTGVDFKEGSSTNIVAGSIGYDEDHDYTITNLVTDRTYDANATSTDELADVLGTLLTDLRAKGIVT